MVNKERSIVHRVIRCRRGGEVRVEAGRVNTRSVFMVVKGKRVHFDRAVPPMAFRDGRLHGPQLRIRIPTGGIQGSAERHRN